MTSQINTMTILGGIKMEDDQQVPDFPVVAPAKPNNTAHLKTNIPDFSSLLLDPLNTTTLNTPEIIAISELTYPEDPTAFMEKPFNSLAWGLDEDLSMYEGVPSAEKKEDLKPLNLMVVEQPQQQQPQQPMRPSSLELIPQQQLSPAPSTTPCSEVASSPETPYVDEGILQDFEEQKKKMVTMCQKLWIPKDPYEWSPEQVQKWAVWVLREYYNLETQFLPGFCMDGTSLCMLSQEDFIQRSTDVGYFLFAELEWWKTVIISEKQEGQDDVIYTDLSQATASLATTPLATTPMTTTPMTTTPTSMATSSMATIPTPVLSNLDETSSTLNQINLEVQSFQHQQQQYNTMASYMNSLSPAPSWEDTTSDSGYNGSPEFTPEEIKVEPMNEDDEYEAAPKSPARRYISHSKHTIHLWQFLKDLLMSPDYYGNYIKWLDRSKGIFKIEDSAQVAKLWGRRKNRPAMNYDKLSRSIRQYYKKGIIKKTSQSKRLVYQFQPNYL